MSVDQIDREKTINYIERFLTKLGYFKTIAVPEKMEIFIQNITLSQFENILCTFNAMLRNISWSKKGTLNNEKDRCVVGEWIGPSIGVRNKILPELLNGLKQLKNNSERAALLYYSILDLHMFEDGNGRTARFLYNLINGDIDLANNIDWYIHSEDDEKTYDGTFETEKGLMNIEMVDYCISFLLQEELNQYPTAMGVLENELSNKSGVCSTSGLNTIYTNIFPITETVRSQLTENEIVSINTLFFDSAGEYSVGGLIMLIIATRKGQIQKWIEFVEEDIRWLLSRGNLTDDAFEYISQKFIFCPLIHPEMFEDWTTEDYKEGISIGERLKYLQLNNLIKIFTTPENFTFDDGTTYIQNIMPSSSTQNRIHD